MTRCVFPIFLALMCSFTGSLGQTLGGNSTFSFLRMQLHPQAAALGGRNVSMIEGDLGLVSENPAHLSKAHHSTLSANFIFLAPSITGLYGIGAYHWKKTATTISLGLQHNLYGSQMQTDASGMILGEFRAYDQMIGLSASRIYGKRWKYGTTFKFINSRYGVYTSLAIAADVGITYHDEDRKLKLGFVAKNMGAQIKTFSGFGEDMPFDLLIGASKQLPQAPFRFSITAQRIHQFDLLYNDTLFNNENYGRQETSGLGTKILSHMIIGSDILVGDRLVFSLGYNVLRRRELRIRNLASGLSGISYGFQLNLNRLKFYFSRAHYQTSLSQNQVSLSFRLQSKD
ncbi:MAG: type IX secretion system protein PorQ [bacterium]